MLVVLVRDVLFQRGGEGDGVRAPKGQREDIPICQGRGVSGECVWGGERRGRGGEEGRRGEEGEGRGGAEVRSHGGFGPQSGGLLGMWEVWEEVWERG